MEDGPDDPPHNSGGGGGGGGRGPRPRGMTGGWGFDDDGGGGGQRVMREPDPPTPDVKGSGGKHSHFDGDDDAVPTIPDLEEEAEEDITRQVAAPPSAGMLSHQPVRSIRELDTALQSRATQLPASPEEGVDLAPLMQCLCSERQVFESDQTWDPELMFQEVGSDINAEITAQQASEEDRDKEDINNT